MSVKELHVFDFDGTLFRSPLPNPANFSPKELGSLKDKGGWFHLPPSLLPPAVPKEPTEEWWIGHIKEKAHAVLSREECKVVLLTGRGVLFTERVKELTQAAGLEFHDYILKPPGNSTLPWKCKVISDLVEDLGDGVKELHIYEDREKHVQKFKQLCVEHHEAGKLEGHSVVPVKEPERYLEDEVEKTVIEEMRRILIEESDGTSQTSTYLNFIKKTEKETHTVREVVGPVWTSSKEYDTNLHASLQEIVADKEDKARSLTVTASCPKEAAHIERLASHYPVLTCKAQKGDANTKELVIKKRPGLVYE
eukprot:TRINITY_DN25405_c0_g1_i1.p1 TRINITY_DN25405_c0_g1~~TRINITY_DN25405_c0_g1_i1.p1  ORF type:complete len:308 (+),score=124.22 TRINITY_DN25405_c0_g1_i1:160-1083(+)